MVGVAAARRDVSARIKTLAEAEAAIATDKAVMAGEPVFKGMQDWHAATFHEQNLRSIVAMCARQRGRRAHTASLTRTSAVQ